MTDEEIKKEIIEELANIGDCSLCRSLGIYGKCKSSSCNDYLTNFFENIIQIKEIKK